MSSGTRYVLIGAPQVSCNAARADAQATAWSKLPEAVEGGTQKGTHGDGQRRDGAEASRRYSTKPTGPSRNECKSSVERQIYMGKGAHLKMNTVLSASVQDSELIKQNWFQSFRN
jgi:hypothetical protein